MCMIFKFKEPKNNGKYYWTKHALEKMKFYGLSEQRVLRVLKSPERCEEGVVEGCRAYMQTLGEKRKTEIWVMVDARNLRNNQQKIVTVWRYPGKSPVRGEVPIPRDVLEQILEELQNVVD